MVTTPQKNDLNWDVSLNAALNDLQSQITANGAAIATKVSKSGDTMTGTLNATSVQASGVMGAAGGAFGNALPAHHNLSAWTFDPALATNSSLTVNGTVYLSKLHVSTDTTITKLYWWVATAGASPVATQNVMGLYSSAGTLLASTNVDADISSTGLKTTTVAATAVTAGSFVWVAALYNATTPPTVARMSGLTGLGTAVNVGLTAATYRFGIAATSQTALPGSITPSSNAAPAFGGPWSAMGV